MKIGIQSAFSGATSPDLIADFGPIIEDRGFHSLWVPEHVVFFRDYESKYPYSDTGRIPGDPDGVMEPLTALTYVAAHTSRIRLGTGILLVPQRNPIYTARQVSDLDYLSNGRFDLGIGVGWLEEEFAALDVPFERRGARTREYLAVMQSLWCDEVSSFEGEFYSLPECLQNPKPIQKPHPPLIFGGESNAALRRVAEIGQGWFAFNMPPQELTGYLEKLDKQLALAGRSRSDVQINVAPPPGPLADDALDAYQALGVDQLILQLFARDADKLQQRADALAKQTLR
jgi:probable F420-dependent oxidoreductase